MGVYWEPNLEGFAHNSELALLGKSMFFYYFWDGLEVDFVEMGSGGGLRSFGRMFGLFSPHLSTGIHILASIPPPPLPSHHHPPPCINMLVGQVQTHTLAGPRSNAHKHTRTHDRTHALTHLVLSQRPTTRTCCQEEQGGETELTPCVRLECMCQRARECTQAQELETGGARPRARSP
jgi:hypothetical protein